MNRGQEPLGTTDLQITPIGFGAWAIGGPDYAFGWGPQDDDDSVAAIQRAIDAGINWIDTAAVYGLGHSERVVARALKSMGLVAPAVRLHEVLARVGRAPARSPTPSRRRRCAGNWKTACSGWKPTSSTSTRFTGRRRGGFEEPAPDIEEGWSTLADLQQEGKVRHIAVSNFDIAEMDRIRPIAPIASLQPPYSMLRRGIEAELLPYCLANRIGVIVYSPMAAGILSGAMTRERATSLPASDWRSKNPEYQEPKLSRNLDLVEELRKIGARYGTSPGAVAIAWTLRQPAVTGAIVGFRSAKQVDGLLAAAALRLTSEEIARIDELTRALEPDSSASQTLSERNS